MASRGPNPAGRADGLRARFAACSGRTDGGRGEGAGLPELEDLFQAGEETGEDGHDERVDRLGNPGALLLCPHSAVQAGDLVAEGG